MSKLISRNNNIIKYKNPSQKIEQDIHLTDDDLMLMGWQRLYYDNDSNHRQVKDDDPLRKTLDESDWWVGDLLGNLVPKEAVLHYWNTKNAPASNATLEKRWEDEADRLNLLEIEKEWQRRKNELFNKDVDTVFVKVPLALLGLGIGGAAALPYLAPGTIGGNIIGTTAFGEALNTAIKYGTGKTMGEHAVNAAHYLGIPQSLWGDYGIEMLGNMPLYMAGDLVGKAVISAGNTLSKEALDLIALNKSYFPTTKDLAKAMNEALNKNTSIETPSTIINGVPTESVGQIILQPTKMVQNKTSNNLEIPIFLKLSERESLLQGAEPEYKYNPKTGEFNISYPRGLRRLWATEARDDVISYFNSDAEYNRLLLSGATPEQALQIMAVRGTNTENALPIVFRNLKSNVYGDALNVNGQALVRLNQRSARVSLSNPDVLKHTVYHELGGHGSSLNIGEQAVTIPENQIDILTQIYKHNEALRPELRPFYQAVKDGNFELAKQIAPEGVLKTRNGEINFKEIQDLIKYMEENLEYVARAHANNIAKHTGLKDGWNIKQLRKYFTDESIDRLLKNVWTILPLGYGLPQLDQPTSNRKGGKLIPRNKI